MSVRVTIEAWRQESDSKIHFKLVDAPGPAASDTMVVDARANYGGGNPKLYKALDALLKARGE